MKKNIYVLGGAGFIGHHLARQKLQDVNNNVIVIDKKLNCEFSAPDYYNEYQQIDLSIEKDALRRMFLYTPPDEIYQFCCLMGGAGYVFTGVNDFEIMSESVSCDINVLRLLKELNLKPTIFWSGTACEYPIRNQLDPNNPKCNEDSIYPAEPDSEYGWSKIFTERMYLAASRNWKLPVKLARFHNIYGPEGSWKDGKEKAPAALCRKIAMLPREGGEIEVWGSGNQTRSFLYIDECLEGINKLVSNNTFNGPVNIGSEEMVSINQLVNIIAGIAGKKVSIKNIKGPEGVMGRNSDNKLIKEKLGWAPSKSLHSGLVTTYSWIESQVKQDNKLHLN